MESQPKNSANLLQQLMQGMASRLNPDAAHGLNATIQFDLTGDEGGAFALIIKNTSCRLEEGVQDDADVVLTMAAPTYLDLALGKTTGSQAFFKRQLRFSGDLSLVMRLHTLFPPVSGRDFAEAAT